MSAVEQALLLQRWYAVPDMLLGGWCVVNRDVASNADLLNEDGGRTIGDLLSENIARHVALLHNLALDGKVKP